jgi:hypothetical protein
VLILGMVFFLSGEVLHGRCQCGRQAGFYLWEKVFPPVSRSAIAPPFRAFFGEEGGCGLRSANDYFSIFLKAVERGSQRSRSVFVKNSLKSIDEVYNFFKVKTLSKT